MFFFILTSPRPLWKGLLFAKRVALSSRFALRARGDAQPFFCKNIAYIIEMSCIKRGILQPTGEWSKHHDFSIIWKRNLSWWKSQNFYNVLSMRQKFGPLKREIKNKKLHGKRFRLLINSRIKTQTLTIKTVKTKGKNNSKFSKWILLCD